MAKRATKKVVEASLPTLNDWFVTLSGDEWTAPEARRTMICGTLDRDSEGFPAGEKVGVYADNGGVPVPGGFMSATNVLYLLGTLEPGYLKWLADNDLSVDPDEPLRVLQPGQPRTKPKKGSGPIVVRSDGSWGPPEAEA